MTKKSEEDNQANKVVVMKLVNIRLEGTSIGTLIQSKRAWYIVDELLERVEDGNGLTNNTSGNARVLMSLFLPRFVLFHSFEHVGPKFYQE